MSPYETLGVERDASADSIKAAFRREASKAHPDRDGGNAARMADVNEAYAVLSDPQRRRQFDETGTTTTAPSLDDEAVQMLAKVFSAALNQDRVGTVQFARDNLVQAQADLTKRQRDASALVARLVKKREKVRTKDGASNLVHGLIDSQVAQLNAATEAIERGLLVASTAVRMLDAYDEDAPPPQPNPAGLWGAGLGGLHFATGAGTW